MTDARVIGAGISGLVAAWCLSETGCRVVVSEAQSQPGGLIQSLHVPEGLVERGPNALHWTDTTRRWFERLNLTPRFPHRVHRRRYIFRAGTARRWPLSLSESARVAARMTYTAATRAFQPRPGEQVTAFVSRVASPAAAAWLVGPMLQGIYAAPADQLSAAAVFGGRRRRRNGLAAPAGGMGQLVDRLMAGLKARGVEFEWNVRVESLDPHVPTVVCTDARSAAGLLSTAAPVVTHVLGRVAYTDAASVTVFFERRSTDLEGFGVLLPDADGFGALGVVFNDCLFEGRSRHRSETWIFGAKLAGVADELLVEALLRERQRLTGRRQTPLATYVTRRSQALPIYNDAVLEAGRALVALPPWITLAGNYLGRLGLADLIERAELAAATLIHRIVSERP